jgi:hypothetical protein
MCDDEEAVTPVTEQRGLDEVDRARGMFLFHRRIG